MKSILRPTRMFILALIVLAQTPAFAWGPDSREAIARSAYQILQYDIYEIAKAGKISYEEDLIRGARDGKAIIGETLPLNSDEQALNAISYEIQQLRAVRENGVGSYFAYRLGALSSLIADTMQPYGNAFTDEEKELKESLDASMDELVYTLSPTIIKHNNIYIYSVPQYIDKNRSLFTADQKLIWEDYRRELGFDGFASNAMEIYFTRSIEAVVDAWYTIMHPKDNPRAGKPSNDSITNYYVNEVGYLINVRGNFDYAKRAFSVYQKTNTDMIGTHIEVGDIFYGFGTPESMKLGVSEWKIAQVQPGKYRKDAASRLSAHYISKGDEYVTHASSPNYFESDLTDAIRSYQDALTYDRTNEIASRKIIEISVRKKKREDSYQKEQTYIDNGLKQIADAEKTRLGKDYAQTLVALNNAISLFEQVGDGGFRDLNETASDNINNVNKSKKTTIREVIEAANSIMEQADDALLNAEFDIASANYSSVKSKVQLILRVVPEGSQDEQSVNALIEASLDGLEDTKRAKERKAKMDAMPKVAATPPGGGSAATPPPPAAAPASASGGGREGRRPGR